MLKEFIGSTANELCKQVNDFEKKTMEEGKKVFINPPFYSDKQGFVCFVLVMKK